MKKLVYLIVIINLFISLNCAVVNQVMSLSQLKYKIDNVSDFQLSGITIADKKTLKDFSIIDGAKLLIAFQKQSLPVDFNLNLLAINTTDLKAQEVNITDFKWRLFIDNVETIKGNIASPIRIPANGESTRFELKVGLDLYKYFNNKGYEGLLNLALKLGGNNSQPSNIKLRVQPTISTIIGSYQYPGEIEIVNTEFR